MKLTHLMSRYSEWIKHNPGKKAINKDIVKTKMTGLYGVPVDGKTYIGIRLIQDDDDISGNLIH